MEGSGRTTRGGSMDGSARKMDARPLGEPNLSDLAKPWTKLGGSMVRVKMGNTGLGEGLVKQGIGAKGGAHDAGDAIGGKGRGAHSVGGDHDSALGTGIEMDGSTGSMDDGARGSDSDTLGGLGGVLGCLGDTLDCGADVVLDRRKGHAMIGGANSPGGTNSPGGANPPGDTYVASDSLGDARSAPGGAVLGGLGDASRGSGLLVLQTGKMFFID
ncbi:unnamed protein product [Ilex paraguariensis]|uniref:Uncharacterized protein n=1 Tax=Ilex paraguariensis TaxID=185542 RepID=A0ABC8S964_9AQUA